MKFKRKKRVFIFGISSFLGYNLALRLKSNYTVSGVYFTNPVFIPGCHIFPLSLQKIDIIDRLVMLMNPDYTIMSIGLNDPKVCVENENLADSINALVPLTLAKATTKAKARFIQLSSALVYDFQGKNRKENYRNFSNTVFGKTKLAGENYIRAQIMESTILRIGRVVGIGNPHRHNYFDKLRIDLARDQDHEGDDKLKLTFLSLYSFLNAIELILAGEFPPQHRIFHLGGYSANEFDFKRDMAASLGYDPKLVKKRSVAKKSETEDDESTGNDDAQKITQLVERDYTIDSSLFTSIYPQWNPEGKDEILDNITRGLTVGYENRLQEVIEHR